MAGNGHEGMHGGRVATTYLPLIAVGEELLLVVEELLVRLGRELEVGALHDGVHGARLLAETALHARTHNTFSASRR
jgi:hypothetical protein